VERLISYVSVSPPGESVKRFVRSPPSLPAIPEAEPFLEPDLPIAVAEGLDLPDGPDRHHKPHEDVRGNTRLVTGRDTAVPPAGSVTESR